MVTDAQAEDARSRMPLARRRACSICCSRDWTGRSRTASAGDIELEWSPEELHLDPDKVAHLRAHLSDPAADEGPGRSASSSSSSKAVDSRSAPCADSSSAWSSSEARPHRSRQDPDLGSEQPDLLLPFGGHPQRSSRRQLPGEGRQARPAVLSWSAAAHADATRPAGQARRP